MKTLIKAKCRVEGNPSYCLWQLENEAEITALIQEAEPLLSQCTHCGAKSVIMYFYNPDKTHPRVTKYSEEPNKIEMVMFPYPHELYAQCGARKGTHDEDACELKGKVWYAEDDEADFKEALRRIVKTWNRRPGDTGGIK